MSKRREIVKRCVNALIFLALIAAVAYFAITSPGKFGTLALVIIGFGAMIFIHELGHFLVAKSADIQCHTFSLGFPPTLFGFRKTEKGWRVRILPSIFTKISDEKPEPSQDQPQEDDQKQKEDQGEQEDNALLTFTIPGKGKPSDTEYCLGLVPVGGYVGMLGQEDADVAAASSNPRSFTNKSVPARMAVIAAGVIFNLIGAFAIFATVAGIGMDMPPAVVGEVITGKPADLAGLEAGDEVLEIAGKTNLDFIDIVLASALSKKNEKVPMTVRHPDGSIEDYEVGTVQIPGIKLRGFGIGKALSLTIGQVDDAGDLFENLGFEPGDKVFSADGKAVSAMWELNEVIEDIRKPTVVLSANRPVPDSGQNTIVDASLGLDMPATNNYDLTDESDLHHIFSIVPRLRITAVSSNPMSDRSRVRILLEDKLRLKALMVRFGWAKPAQKESGSKPVLKVGDIVVKIGDVDFPTFLEVRQVTAAHDDKEMVVTVLRRASDSPLEQKEVTVVPKTPRGGTKPLIGIGLVLDTQTPIVAKTINSESGPLALNIPRGATITAVDGMAVSDYYDVIDIIGKSAGQRISLEYRIDERQAGAVGLAVPADSACINVTSELSSMVPFEALRRTYKAENAGELFSMAYRRMTGSVVQTYATLKGLIVGLLSPDTLMGPIGIVSFSYKIVAAKEFTYYLNFLGMISAMLAVLNFLPIPIVDGGVFLLLIIEKIKGSPISMRVQQAVVYAGLALLGLLFIYVTCKDILNLLVPQ